ncbi:MAG TPA: hypothetical protein VJB87_04400 [Candidatus Nanoarchaeia archaeon]|nr:hypothetical protein [Candidatus Nanoarchaeia archaeon]
MVFSIRMNNLRTVLVSLGLSGVVMGCSTARDTRLIVQELSTRETTIDMLRAVTEKVDSATPTNSEDDVRPISQVHMSAFRSNYLVMSSSPSSLPHSLQYDRYATVIDNLRADAVANDQVPGESEAKELSFRMLGDQFHPVVGSLVAASYDLRRSLRREMDRLSFEIDGWKGKASVGGSLTGVDEVGFKLRKDVGHGWKLSLGLLFAADNEALTDGVSRDDFMMYHVHEPGVWDMYSGNIDFTRFEYSPGGSRVELALERKF